MPWKFKNIHYSFKPGETPLHILFHSLWDVRADSSYSVVNPTGFNLAGAFITHGGKGHIRLDRMNGIQELPAGSIYIISQNDPVTYWCPQDGRWDFFFIRLNDPEIVSRLNLSLNTLISCQDPAFLYRQGERIINEMIHQATGYAFAADLILRQLLLTAARPQTGALRSTTGRLVEWMHRNLDAPISIPQLQQITGSGRTSLFKSFKQEHGTSPANYFINLKLESARLQLQTTMRKIHRISADLGFYDEFYFSRMFKRTYGLAPGAFRKMYRINPGQ